ncbi:MAG: UbiD family decarboxylase [Candidatus Aenigmarchaeota archaeon]|nr:UbiD family decarboxylase [Candidatus Aenigmarchaeota archaeon]
MNLRSYIKKLDAEKKLIRIKKPVASKYEAANILAELDGTPVIFENINDHKIQVAGNLNSSRDLVAMALGTEKEKLLELMSKSINNLKSPKTVKTAPCQEVVEKDINLKNLPIMTYLKEDGGPYIPSAIIVVKDKELGRNVCFHRMMVIGKDKLAVRVVENRGTYNALKKSKGNLEVAICIGNSTAVLLAAATSIKPNEDEFALANAIEKTDLVKCKTVDLEVPADTEIVLEGIITDELADEGPFMDLTGTLDFVRKQPTIKINCITRRKDAIYQTLLPGLSEHKILMGMPREPTILNEVKKVVKCKIVLLTPGGNAWLHAVVQIEKRKADDGKKAIEAAFKGHNSLKLVTVVDDDINLYDSADVEWALSTRFQAAKDTIIMLNQPSSSLDPSAEKKDKEKTKTSKLGLDATIPWDKNRKEFEKSGYKKINLKKYI